MVVASPGRRAGDRQRCRTDEGCIGELTVLEAMRYGIAGIDLEELPGNPLFVEECGKITWTFGGCVPENR